MRSKFAFSGRIEQRQRKSMTAWRRRVNSNLWERLFCETVLLGMQRRIIGQFGRPLRVYQPRSLFATAIFADCRRQIAFFGKKGTGRKKTPDYVAEGGG